MEPSSGLSPSAPPLLQGPLQELFARGGLPQTAQALRHPEVPGSVDPAVDNPLIQEVASVTEAAAEAATVVAEDEGPAVQGPTVAAEEATVAADPAEATGATTAGATTAWYHCDF